MLDRINLKNKILSSTIIFLMICSCFTSTSSYFDNSSRDQPSSALDELEIGLGSDAEDHFGWNVSSAGDVNGDTYADMIVGAPGDDSNGQDAGAAYVFLGNANPEVYGIDPSNADIVITGIAAGDKFGWDVDGAGDVNNDGLDDIIVGAPGYANGNGKAYIFYGGTMSNGTAGIADVTLNGTGSHELFGHSVAAAGNVNGDNFDDVIVGGPLGDRAYIFFGQSNVLISYTNLYDTDGDHATPETDFTSGINTTSNSPDIPGAEDGWDWYLVGVGPYGGDSSAVEYNVDPNRDNNPSDSTIDTDGEIIIGIGDDYGDGAHGDSPESGAYGLEFQIGSAQMAVINNGGRAEISFDWWFDDSGTGTYAGLDSDEEVWVKCRFGDLNLNYLGYHLDTGDNHADTMPEVFWMNNPYDTSWDTFSYDITSLISSAGTYYFDLGGRIRTWGAWGSSTEDGIFHFDNILLKFTTQTQSTILEGSPRTSFGSSVTGVGNFNGATTGFDDVAVGAPLSYKGHTHVYFGKSVLPQYIPVSNTDLDFTGIQNGEMFGWSISGEGDINNDNYNDLIIGAPGADKVYVHLGKALHAPPLPIYPDLWDDNVTTPNVVDFDYPGDEVNTNANTFGLAVPATSADDDGWDWEIGTYGQILKGGPTRAHHYDPEPETENLTFDGSKRLEVQVGPTHAGNDGSTSEILDSAAWGVQIDITPAMYSAISNGGEAYLSLDWQAQDTEDPGSGTEERCYVKARFGTPAGYNYLGTNIGGDADPDLFYWRWSGGGMNNPWGPYQGTFQGRITNYITSSDFYYLDFGAKFDADTSGQQGNNEGIRAYFDNIAMVIYPRVPHDIVIDGNNGDKFGFSVSCSGTVDNDNFDDIIVGAPYDDTANGVDSGAMYVFLGSGALPATLDAGLDVDYQNYGEATNESFGRSVAWAGNVDGDLYSEVVIGTPYQDSDPPQSYANAGKVYVLTLVKKPKITLNYPTGGEFVSGLIEINATATDSDNNIDSEGVRFYISTDASTWDLLGNDPTPSSGIFYTLYLNTLTLEDSINYFIKADATDLDLNSREVVSGMFTVNNLYPPELQITNPAQDEVVVDQLTIEALGHDSALDLIGGGINETLGVRFYLSEDNLTWSYLGNDNSTPKIDNIYQIDLDTTTMVDGQYWAKANITDLDDMFAKDIVNFEIDNPARAPVLDLLYPVNVTELAGTVNINATALDMDDDINSSGVSFYYSKDEINWVFINNDDTPDAKVLYQTTWDTTTVNDDWYWVKAFVNDTTGLTATNISEKFIVHNSYLNPPIVNVIHPNYGEEVRTNVDLKASAYDPEDNINVDGVKFYYSSNMIDWNYIGYSPDPELSDETQYTLSWNTLLIPDGRYWLNATCKDMSLLTGWDLSDEPFYIHNTELNSPFLNLVTPNGGEVLTGSYTVSAEAGDLEENIDGNGVTYYYSSDKANWTRIGNAPSKVSPIPSSPQMYTYNLSWDTTKVPDGEYWLNVSATDTHGFVGWDFSDDTFFIHNSQSNEPIVKVEYPNGGEILAGTVTLQGTGYDLEKNIDASGLKFYYSNDDQSTWDLIGNNASGLINVNRPLERTYYLTWDTTTVPDGYYWLKAEATDLTGYTGSDLSDDSFIIHNTLVNPPTVKLITPQDNETISRRIGLEAEVDDLEDNIDKVEFYYSLDGDTWILIGVAQDPKETDSDIYMVLWNTEDVVDGEYWIKIIAIDDNSQTGEYYSGRLFVDNGITEPEEKDTGGGFIDEFMLIIIIIIILIVIFIVVFAILRKKRREKDKMDETLSSITPPPIPIQLASDFETTPRSVKAAVPVTQTLLPAPPLEGEGEDAGKDFEQKLTLWKSQGYNISRLEDLIDTDMEAFWDVLPIFINNINNLNELKPRFNALDTTGYEDEAASIRQKINDPDQAPVVEQEIVMLEDLIGQKKKLKDEEAAEDAKAKVEEETADFGTFLPTDEKGSDVLDEDSDPLADQDPLDDNTL